MSFEVNEKKEEVLIRREKIEEEIKAFKGDVLEKFSEADQTKIFAALDFMLKIHLPQDDRFDGFPFASHPLMVARKVMELHSEVELVIAALIHDSVEDQSERIFVERIERKNLGGKSLSLEINEDIKEKYNDIFKDWSFKEINDRFGSRVEDYVRNMTNHDFNSLAESLNLVGDERNDFINKMYAEHVEDIISKPDLLTLKLADLSTNIDLKSLGKENPKYIKLKRKYKSVIENILVKVRGVDVNHYLYSSKEKIADDLEKIYQEQYC